MNRLLAAFRRCRLIALFALLPALTGCGFFRPTLRAIWCSPAPLPNGLVEKYPWEKAPTLTVQARRGSGAFSETRSVQIKACTDGRALSILVRWVDEHEAKVGRFWVWDDERGAYQLEQYPVDQLAVLWPITPHASFKIWDGKSAVYDAWQWSAGWSDLAGYADDRRLFVRHHPWGAQPGQLKGQLYPLGRRKGLVELEWRNDAGVPGAVPMPRPVTFFKHRLDGIEVNEPLGSVADVRAKGVYTPRLRSNGEGKKVWSYHPQGDDWFVEFYRLLVTASKDDDDYQLRGYGPHRFALALWDNSSNDSFYLTEPIRLVLARPGK